MRRRASSPGAGSRTGPTARKERIVYVTIGYALVALDAKTGVRVPLRHGRHSRSQGDDDQQRSIPLTGDIGLHAAPFITKDVIVVGAAPLSWSGAKSRIKTSKDPCVAMTAERQEALGVPHNPRVGESAAKRG